MDVAWLRGGGWGRWRGWWSSKRTLVSRGGWWSLLEAGEELWRLPSFHRAMRRVWDERATRGEEPLLVGWMGFEEALRAAGMPGRPVVERGGITAAWLVEPGPNTPESLGPASGGPAPGANWLPSLSDERFRNGVEAILRSIAAGEVYQVNLTRRFTIEPWHGGLGDLLELATTGGTPPYLAWMSLGGMELACASMELLLRRRGDLLETRPIKGTRPRGSGREEDRLFALELDADPKERSELSMVVDLERNDLGRVAVPASVRVVDDGSVHRFATVLHRVARVVARLRPELRWWDAMTAMIPGGSVTGCPKPAAISLLAALEPVDRGPYTGVLGVVDGRGNLELALPIRTAWRKHTTVACASGCGIVWGSDPRREELESRLKLAPWLEASWSI
ncbi:MAG: anthranilate synthase component I family protein [Acidobacteria bacterium]|nr:anthranilate synthase component I family protein [Acidobacteriota bacterium]